MALRTFIQNRPYAGRKARTLNHTSAEKHISKMQITGSSAVTRTLAAGEASAVSYLEKSATKREWGEIDPADKLMHSSSGDVFLYSLDLNVRTNPRSTNCLEYTILRTVKVKKVIAPQHDFALPNSSRRKARPLAGESSTSPCVLRKFKIGKCAGSLARAAARRSNVMSLTTVRCVAQMHGLLRRPAISSMARSIMSWCAGCP